VPAGIHGVALRIQRRFLRAYAILLARRVQVENSQQETRAILLVVVVRRARTQEKHVGLDVVQGLVAIAIMANARRARTQEKHVELDVVQGLGAIMANARLHVQRFHRRSARHGRTAHGRDPLARRYGR